MKTPFLGGSSTARSSNAAMDRAVNIYPEMTPNGKDVGAFFGTPGMVEWADVTGSVRGTHQAGDFLYVVAGNAVKKVSEGGTVTVLGTIQTSQGRVSMADNGEQIIIVDGVYGYLVTLSDGTVSRVTGAGFPNGCRTIAYQDGYFLAEQPDSQIVWQSDLYAGNTWDALSYASKEGGPDPLLAVFSDHRELWLFGTKTTEVWYNAGNLGFAFSRIQGAYLEIGLQARFSVAKLDNSIIWLGDDGIVYRANGYQPTRISTHAVEYAFGLMGTTSDSFAWSYKQEGHAFYCLTFTSARQTWCFDSATQQWHERAGFANGELIEHPATTCIQFNDDILVGTEDGKLCKLDLSAYDDNGTTIKRLRRWGHIGNAGKKIFISGLQLFAETGVGTNGTQPMVMLRWSDDGGHTWSNEHWVTLGNMGKYAMRALWSRLGSSFDRVFEVSMTDPVKCAWIGAELDAQ